MRFWTFILLGVSLGCARPAAPVIAAAPKPELALEGVTLRVYRDSEPKLFARAAKVELMRSTGALTAEQVRFDFLANDLALDAQHLSGNLVTLGFDLTRGVTLQSSGADPKSTLYGTTAAARFEGKDGAHGVASGKAPVELHGLSDGRPYTLTAARFTFDVAEQHATFEPASSKVGAQ